MTGQLCYIIALWWSAAVNLLSFINKIMLYLQGMQLVLNTMNFYLLCYVGKILLLLVLYSAKSDVLVPVLEQQFTPVCK